VRVPKPVPTTPVVEDKEPVMTKAHVHALTRTTTGLANRWCDGNDDTPHSCSATCSLLIFALITGCRATNLTVSYRCADCNFDMVSVYTTTHSSGN
jgi:hypothetical protein